MTATDQMRALLDQLMGTQRDGDRPEIEFDDPRVCKSFLLGCCPHEILSGTRMDIGECSKLHDVALKADYEKKSQRREYYFEFDALDHLESFIADCDRRTEAAKRKLKETQEELSEEAKQKADEIHKLGEEIGTKLAKAEQMGAEGHVEESLKALAEVEELNKKKALVETEFRNTMPSSSYQQQKLRVCEVCSAYLGVHDNDRRLADHFGGKLHIGFIEIRERLEELRKIVALKREERDKRREERRRKGRSRSRDRRSRRSRSRSRDRHRSRRSSRDRERHRGRRSRSRSRERHRRRSRSRSRDSRHRHRGGSSRRDRRSSSGGIASDGQEANVSDRFS